MHPMFVKLFIEADADDLLAEEEVKRRRARRSVRNRPAVAVRAAAGDRDPQPRPAR
jgi:hypothetical protein